MPPSDLTPLPDTTIHDLDPSAPATPSPHIVAPSGHLTIAAALCYSRPAAQRHPFLLVHVDRYDCGRAEHLAGAPNPAENSWHGGPIAELLSDLGDELALSLAARAADRDLARLLAVELLVNALGHRSFESQHQGRPVQVTRFTDQLRVTSPGPLHCDIHLNAKHLPAGRCSRNPVLMGLLTRAGLAHQQGRGVVRMAQIAPELGYQLRYDTDEEAVVAVLEVDPALIVRAERRTTRKERRRRIHPDVVDGQVLEALSTQRTRTRKDLQRALDLPLSTLRAALERLLEKDLIERTASAARSPHQAYRRKTERDEG